MANETIQTLLKERDLLPILTMNDGTPVTKDTWPERRKELLHSLATYSYGFTPAAPDKVWSEKTAEDEYPFGDLIRLEKRDLLFQNEKGTFSFPFQLYIPEDQPVCPAFIFLSFDRTAINDFEDNDYQQIVKHGFALARISYTDVVNDEHYGDYSDGMAKFFGTDNPREKDEWGKIGMWAYACSRILDYLLTRDDMDAGRNVLLGHSRLGKSILWAAAQDERFTCVIDNASGYGGAATSKHGTGERVMDFQRAGSWDWFCQNFQAFSFEKEDCKPYDQSFLLALIAPRPLCIGTASDDWACDPESVYLSLHWASQGWTILGEKGFITPDRLPVPGDSFHEGTVGFHMRKGGHRLSQVDWDDYFEFLKSHI